LVLERSSDLRGLEHVVIEGLGFDVVASDDIGKAVDLARQSQPVVIVLGVPYDDPGVVDAVDRLHNEPQTREIPVVVVSTSEQRAATAQASPNVRYALVAPYDVEALESAVETALHNPPVPAALPKVRRSVPPKVRQAAEELNRHARAIVLDALREIRQNEPYRSRFPELSVGLVDDLGTIFGAIVHGLEIGLTRAEAFSPPVIRHSVESHAQLRKRQGLGATAAILEVHILERQIDRFLGTLIGTSGFTAADAFAISQEARDYLAELVRILVFEYTA
jgi:CheY-like chemotaxis protein